MCGAVSDAEVPRLVGLDAGRNNNQFAAELGVEVQKRRILAAECRCDVCVYQQREFVVAQYPAFLARIQQIPQRRYHVLA